MTAGTVQNGYYYTLTTTRELGLYKCTKFENVNQRVKEYTCSVREESEHCNCRQFLKKGVCKHFIAVCYKFNLPARTIQTIRELVNRAAGRGRGGLRVPRRAGRIGNALPALEIQ